MVNVKLKCSRTGSDWTGSWGWVDGHKNTSDFYLLSCQSTDIPVPMLLLRGLMLSICCMILIWAVCFQLTPLWFVYLTNWGLMALVSMNLFGFIVSLMAATRVLPAFIESGSLPWYVQCFWLFSNIGTSMCLLITLLYFILLFDARIIDELGWEGFFLDMCTHGVTSILVVIELTFSRTPVYLLHFYQPLCIGLWYAVFTAIFYACGGTVNGFPFIYEIINWEYPKRTSIVVTLSAVGVIGIYILVWLIALVRTTLAKNIVSYSSEVLRMAVTTIGDPVRYV